MERYVCIHGHFYQPPRENPWLEAVEVQDSAYPYHDWNERVTAECYAPNTASRIMDADNRIREIVNNYSKISFNFGPTLLAWMEKHSPDVYAAILDADRESARRLSGHGSAIAQAYHHTILPLSNARDKRTQVRWGMRDFEHRFGRLTEGLWLPETAVDLETLNSLAQEGIKFTILAPSQAARVRAIGARAWRDVSGGKIDPSMAYRIRLRGNKTLALFFYDGPISRAVAFEDLLERGENLAGRLCEAFSDSRPWPQLVHIATDGETYGHHRRHGDMALAYALHHIETNNLARLTNYGEYLERHPPTHEVQIVENSSWSCIHGVERWKSNCGCNAGTHPGWHQEWRQPLRNALDWLRDTLAPRFEQQAGQIFTDPWRARDEYICVLLNGNPDALNRFLAAHAAHPLSQDERTKALQLMELQRHAMLMYTSCGWFFDELSGIEPVQVIQYAGRALQLAETLFGDQIEEQFLELLSQAKSNVPEHGDGRLIYEKFVKPAIVDLKKVGAHYAISSMFTEYPEQSRIYAFDVVREDSQVSQEGRMRLALGRARVTSRVTEESETLAFGVLHLGDQNLSGGVREQRSQESYDALVKDLSGVFHRGDIPELVRAVDRQFGAGIYSLRLLFRDEQHKIVNQILEQALGQAASLYRNFYGQYATLARFVTELGISLPPRFRMAVDFTVNEDLMAALSVDQPDAAHVRSLVEQARETGISLDTVTLEFAFRKTVERAAREFQEDLGSLDALQRLDRIVSLRPLLPFEVNLWCVQNVYQQSRQLCAEEYGPRAARGDPEAVEWLAAADSLGEKLGFHIEAGAAEGGA